MSSNADGANAAKPSGAWRSWLLGIILVAALVGAVLRFGEIENFARLIARANPLWFALAVLFQLSTYAGVAAGWATVLHSAGTPRPLPRLMRIAITKLFADQAVPSAGMGGNVLLVDQLVRLRVPRGTAVAALLVSMIGYYAAFAFFAVAMLVLLWLHDKATPLMAGVVTTFLLVALAIPSLALWLRHRGSQPLSPRLERMGVVRNLFEIVGQAPAKLIGDRQLLVRVTGFNGWVFLADAATLWACLHALGEPASFGTGFIALIMASIVVTLGPIPLGLGSFEATSTATLGLLRVPIETAFAATMLLRILTLWLPLLPGLLMMRSALKRRPFRSRRSSRSDSASGHHAREV
ncbi:lysylphosphatidylglycerol synthase transmembrane domain-containing protein [Novosphingobium sp. BL-52-GroH]|uniref:lysylphosphatidylglycerol synthase transmembrane domain-containing protein n=1 Tax=Novosphingobium sp. BL-52-GroH TaxID=3349877 RepID=UPI00384E7751